MKRFATAAFITLIGLSLTACFQAEPRRPQTQIHRPMPQGIEGRWVDPNGISSSFRNGLFETRSADTNEKLSEGNYVMRSPNLAEIEMRSLVRGTVSRVNCSLSGPIHLMCTTQEGSQFTLTRRG